VPPGRGLCSTLGGTGVPPVNHGPKGHDMFRNPRQGNDSREGHGQNARATKSGRGMSHGRDAAAENSDASQIVTMRRGAYLPHWTQEGSVYAITFRLHDSLPRETLEELKAESAPLSHSVDLARHGRQETHRAESAERLSERVERWLDSGCGSCHLRDDRAAQIVARALSHFDGDRYSLIVWCVMPNHVHAVVRPLGRHSLPGILHSWKSYTAKEINNLLGRRGELWQPEYYDRIIRDEDEFQRLVRYIIGNPATAGLNDWKWVGFGRGMAVG
jgi:REP element-mobilizing transposase RayT